MDVKRGMMFEEWKNERTAEKEKNGGLGSGNKTVKVGRKLIFEEINHQWNGERKR